MGNFCGNMGNFSGTMGNFCGTMGNICVTDFVDYDFCGTSPSNSVSFPSIITSFTDYTEVGN